MFKFRSYVRSNVKFDFVDLVKFIEKVKWSRRLLVKEMFTLTQPFHRETNSILNPSISQLYQKRNL